MQIVARIAITAVSKVRKATTNCLLRLVCTECSIRWDGHDVQTEWEGCRFIEQSYWKKPSNVLHTLNLIYLVDTRQFLPLFRQTHILHKKHSQNGKAETIYCPIVGYDFLVRFIKRILLKEFKRVEFLESWLKAYDIL